jgi:CHAT domain-containing protein
MFDTNEDRQTAYQQLVQALLNCPQNTEDRVLAANPDLVNEGLVKALRDTAERKIDPNDPSEATTIEWLFNFAEQLAQKLSGDRAGEDYQRFAIDLLQVVADSQGDSDVVHQFLNEHTTYLNEQFLAILPHQIKTLFEQEDDLEWRFHISSTVGNLGNELQQLPNGNRGINLELAISCYTRALLVLTQADFPIEWATTENNRASAYSDRIQGDRSVNLESAIAGFDRALLVLTQADFPIEWATTENNRASAYSDRIQGDRLANLELAIAGYDRALLVLTQADYPTEWATTEGNRAKAHADAQAEQLRREPKFDEQKTVGETLYPSSIQPPVNPPLELTEEKPDLPVNSPVELTEEKLDPPVNPPVELAEEKIDRSAEIEISNQTEKHQTAYRNLIQLLLQCPHGDEYRVLAAHPDLVDEGLVMALVDTAEIKANSPNPDAITTVQWLIHFAEKLARKLGFELSDLEGMERKEIHPSSSQSSVYSLLELNKEKIGLPVELEIPNPNEERQTAYRNLIELLLQCPSGDEYRVLAAHPDLVDEGLVMALVDVAEMKADNPDSDTIATMQWLVDFAEKLAGKLGFEVSDMAEMDREEIDYVEFSIDLLQTVANSEGYVNVVHQFLDLHLDYLTPTLLATFPRLIETLLEREQDPERKSYIISTLYNLSIDLSEFPRGDRSIVLQLSILCQERFLSVITQAAELAQQKELKESNVVEEESTHYLNLTENDYWNFFIELFQTVAAREEDGKSVHQFLDEHINYLDSTLLDLFPGFIEKLFAQINNPDTIFQTAAQFESLAVDFNRYPRGDRSIVVGLGIACHEQASSARIDCEKSIEDEKNRANLAKESQSTEIEIEDGDNWGFFVELFKVTLNSQGDKEIVHQFLDKYLTHLTPRFLALFPGFLNKLFAAFDDPETTGIITAQFDSLGLDLETFPRGDRSINLELAIACYERILLEYSRDKFPLEWAKTNANLANAYGNRIEGEKTKNLELAISRYETALLGYNLADFPNERAEIQANLENARTAQMERHSAKNIQQQSANQESAIAWYDRVLTLYSPVNSPIDWATAIENLATLHTGEDDLKSIDLYHQALEVFTPANFPLKAFNISHNLGQIHFKQGEWQLAIDAYETAMKSVETAQIEMGNEQMEEDALYIYEKAIQCAINLGDYSKAIQYTERSRSRQLVELSGTTSFHTNMDMPPEIAANLAEYADLNHQIQAVREPVETTKTTRNAVNLSHEANKIVDLERQKDAIYHKIRSLDPAIAAQIAVESIDFHSIQKLITTAHTAILTCYSTAEDTYIFIIKQSGAPILHTCKDRGWQKFQKWLQNAWIQPYHQDFSTWKQTFPRLLHNIADRLQLDTLIGHLTDINELIISPHLNLHQVPFAALPVIGEDYLLGDKFTIRTIPSCQMLQYIEHPAISSHVAPADDSLIGAVLMGEHYIHANEVFRATSENATATTTLVNGFSYISPSTIQSTLWSVDDFVTAIFNHLYHQERQKGVNCATSLQTAQLRLKNLTRAELHDIYYPKAIEYLTQHNPDLLPNLEAHVKAYCESEHPFNHPYYWAAFVKA